MTNEELLAGFLDRSLSEDQLLEFESRREADVEFGRQAQSMIRVERVLPMAAPVIFAPTDFLQAVEADVATKVASGAASSAIGSVATSTWGWIAGAGVAALTAGGVYVATQSTEPVEAAAVPIPVAVEQQISAPAEVTPPVVKAPARESAPVQRVVSTRAQPVVQEQSIKSDVASTQRLAPPRVVDMSAESTDPALESLVSDLESSRSNGNLVRSAQLGLALGRTYRERGNLVKAEQFLGQALIDARSERTIEYEVNILGEMALNAVQSGRKNDAREYLYKAVSIGEKAGIDVSDWKRMINVQE